MIRHKKDRLVEKIFRLQSPRRYKSVTLEQRLIGLGTETKITEGYRLSFLMNVIVKDGDSHPRRSVERTVLGPVLSFTMVTWSNSIKPVVVWMLLKPYVCLSLTVVFASSKATSSCWTDTSNRLPLTGTCKWNLTAEPPHISQPCSVEEYKELNGPKVSAMSGEGTRRVT